MRSQGCGFIYKATKMPVAVASVKVSLCHPHGKLEFCNLSGTRSGGESAALVEPTYQQMKLEI